MKLFYEINFSALSSEEKVKFVYGLRNNAAESFADKPASIQLLAHTLIFTRWWNSYKHMAPKEPTPEILGIAIELLWDFQEGKCGEKEFTRFQKSVCDSALEILTGDDSELNEDPESDAFSRKYFTPWEAISYNVFLSNLCTVLEEAVSRDFTWDAVEGVIYGDIGDTIIAFFETVYRSPNGRSRSCDIEHREKDTYNTPTFTVEIRQSGS